MNKFFEVKLFDKSKDEDDKQKVIINPLAISSILPSEEKDVIKMQNGDEYVVEHVSNYPATNNLLAALKIEIKK
jgi:hypothetical protein